MEQFTVNKETVEKLKRRGLVAADVAISAAMKQMADEKTVIWSAGIGLIQGLKYNGSLKRGIKAGLTAHGVIGGVNAMWNVARNWDKISKS